MRALITGITGQDGSYLAELLLAKGYMVHGLVRRAWSPSGSRIEHLYTNPDIYQNRLFLHRAELDDAAALRQALHDAAPDEVYYLASQSHVGLSFEMPEVTCQLIAMGTLRVLEIIRSLKPVPKFFHASSSEVFGEPIQAPQDESTPFAPVSPYGCAKAFATQIVRVYRRSYGLFACNGILFNHESPRRAEGFVTRKICRAAAAISLGLEKELTLGDMGAQRDWGHARDYVEGMWLMLQHDQPEEFVLATGRLHSVQDVVEQAFATVALDWTKHIRHDPSLSRPSEPRRLVGNAAKAQRLLGWQPRITFEQLIKGMTQAELSALSKRSRTTEEQGHGEAAGS
jgi:GDPmannose 4,6-dehydratase